MGKIIHFEIPADDVNKLSGFYKKTFGWEIKKVPALQYWIIDTGKGINGGMMQKVEPHIHVMNTIDVKSVDESAKEIVKNGGKIISEKMIINGIGYIFYFKDIEGNIFSIMQSDPNARM